VTTLDSDLPPADPIDEYETEPLPLPRRTRLPFLTALLALGVVGAGMFIAGVEVQKHEGGSTSSGAGSAGASFASRLGRTSTTGTTSGSATGSGGFGGLGATIGTVTAIKGSTLYVTDSSGNVVKVTTSPASTVSKTVSSSVKKINPGDTVVIRGSQAKNGTIAAESISVGTAGSFGSRGGGDASGFGGGSSSGGSSSGGATGFGGGG
jgi:hypothetical protein